MDHPNIHFKEPCIMPKMSKFLCGVMYVGCLLVVILVLIQYLMHFLIVLMHLSLVNVFLAIKLIVQHDPVFSLGTQNCKVFAKFCKTVNFFQTRSTEQKNKIQLMNSEIQNFSTLKRVLTDSS